MNELHLDFYGIPFSIVSMDRSTEPVFEWLRADLEYFITDEPPERTPHRLILYARDGEGIKHALMKTKMCEASGWLGPRVCDYGDGTVAVLDTTAGVHEFLIYSRDLDRMFEVALVALLSASGEALDQKGFHRVHAAGFVYRDRAHLLLLPEGRGKSSMSLLLMKNPEVRFFSDECPLLKDGMVYPFPLRFAVKPEVATLLGLKHAAQRIFRRKDFPNKVLFPVAPRRVADPMRVETILLGRDGERPAFEEAGKMKTVDGLFRNMVVGLGLAQMREFMIRRGNAGSLFKIATSRLHEAIEVSRHSRAFTFTVGPDPRPNFEALRGFLESNR
ncbi:MAG: hypothetical protein ABL958_05030 [Bdellovibrionia bacterium]